MTKAPRKAKALIQSLDEAAQGLVHRTRTVRVDPKPKKAAKQAAQGEPVDDKPPKVVKTTVIVPASEWAKRLGAIERMEAKERAEFLSKRRLEVSVEDIRDDAVSAIMNRVGGTIEDKFMTVHGRGGPHPSTLFKWHTRETMRPQLAKLRAALMAVDLDLGVVDQKPRR